MGPFSPPKVALPSVPAVTAEYVSAVQPAAAGGAAASAPQATSYRLFRAADGNTRVDTGNLSIINLPAAGKTITLDHLKQEARISQATPQMPQSPAPQMPGVPGMPGMPQMPATQVQDLGKSVMHGLEVEGKRYTIQPPAIPHIPGMPQVPGMPKAPGTPSLPGMPAAPKIPGAPQGAAPGAPTAPGVPGAPQIPGVPKIPAAALPKPQMPSIAEVWTAPKVQLPMASKISGGFGQQTTMCQKVQPGEPNPAVFQIPPTYKVIALPPPKPPAIPGVPALPHIPGVPPVPGTPSVPPAPKVPKL